KTTGKTTERTTVRPPVIHISDILGWADNHCKLVGRYPRRDYGKIHRDAGTDVEGHRRGANERTPRPAQVLVTGQAPARATRSAPPRPAPAVDHQADSRLGRRPQ